MGLRRLLAAGVSRRQVVLIGILAVAGFWAAACFSCWLAYTGAWTLPSSVAAGVATTAVPSVAVTVAETPSATMTGTSTPLPATATPSGTPSPRPTRTPSHTPSRTPTRTRTPAPSPTITGTATSAPPAVTATFTPAATPGVDFRLKSWRLWPLELNGGCQGEGMHEIFIIVEDANGQPLDGVVVGDTWNNVEDFTGRKGPGRAEIDLYANTMEITVKRDQATGQPYTSEVSPPCASYITTIPDEQLVAAGYFANELEAQWNRENFGYKCGGHFSWEVIFQRTY